MSESKSVRDQSSIEVLQVAADLASCTQWSLDDCTTTIMRISGIMAAFDKLEALANAMLQWRNDSDPDAQREAWDLLAAWEAHRDEMDEA